MDLQRHVGGLKKGLIRLTGLTDITRLCGSLCSRSRRLSERHAWQPQCDADCGDLKVGPLLEKCVTSLDVAETVVLNRHIL